MQPIDIATSIRIHHGFVKYTLTTRHGSNDEAFKTPLTDFDFAPASIFYHGIHALYRMVKMIDEPELNFREIPMYRKPEMSISEELITIYDEIITSFEEKLRNMSIEEVEKEISSPLSGKPIRQMDWFAQSVMHCIHHVGQAIRIQGMVDRKLSGKPVSFETVKDYTNLFAQEGLLSQR